MSREARFWDRMATRYDEAPRKAAFQEAIADALAHLGPGDVVLDLGCGSGPVARELRPHVTAVHGIDISPEMIRIARRNEAPGLTFEQTTLDAPSLDERGFTAIVAFNVLHFLDLDQAFRRFAEILPAGGRLLINAACLRDVHPVVRGGLWMLGKATRMPPMTDFGVEELERRIAEAGLELVESRQREAWSRVQWLVARKP